MAENHGDEHSLGGVGRTATGVGAHLVRHGLPGDEAFVQLQALRSATPKADRGWRATAAQRAIVRGWNPRSR